MTQTTLHFERTGIGAGGSHAGFPEPGPKGGMLGRRAGDAALDEALNSKLTLAYADVAELARTLGRGSDPLVRQQLARLYAYGETGRWNALRGRAEASRGGGQAVASIGKLSQTRIVKLAANLSVAIAGQRGLLTGDDASDAGASRRRSRSRRRRPFTAAPTRSSATSSRSAPWDCRVSRHPTAAAPSRDVLQARP